MPFYAAIYRKQEEARHRAERNEALRVQGLLPRAAAMLRRDFGARRVGWFGSLYSGKLRRESDVDLYVDCIRHGGHFVAVDRLVELLGRQVDLVELEKAPASLRDRIAEPRSPRP